VRKIIRDEFTILEELNKFDELGADRFGYGAWHFIVRLGQRTAGARYEDLRELLCEIQVRTVAQDAWAILQHHLVYKQESGVPARIQRQLNALAGQFETADELFDKLRKDREDYLEQVRQSPDLSTVALDLDTFTEYLGRWFPGRPAEGYDSQLRLVFNKLLAAGFKTLKPLDQAIADTADDRRRLFQEYGLADIRKTPDGKVPASLETLFAVAMATTADLAVFRFNDRWRAALERYREPRKTG
jgi:hypothetical protein